MRVWSRPPSFNAYETIREFQISPLSCGVWQLFICVIKLKDIIEEIKKGTKLPVFPISPMEEAQSLQTIRNILIPFWVNQRSKNPDIINDLRQNLKKVKIFKRQGIIRAIRYQARCIWWLIRKDRKGKLEILDYTGHSFNIDGRRGKTWGKSAGEMLNEELEPLHLSKREEAEAVNYIKIRIIPEIAELFNEVYPLNSLIGKDGKWTRQDTGLRIKPSDISQILKKTHRHWGYEYDKNIELITYSADVQLTQRQKGHQKHHLFDFYIYKDRPSGKIKIEVNLHLSSYGNKIFVLHTPLLESVNPDHLKVSKKEEAEAVSFIKRVSIPYAVLFWNKNSPQHWQLKEEDMTRLLKKVNVSHGPGGDFIIYKVQFKISNTKSHEFVFTIFKSDLVNKLSVQMKLNLHKAGDYTFDVAQSS